jgi:hypothetical protein
MPLEHDTFIAPANTSADTINRALRDYPAVRVVGSQLWEPDVITIGGRAILKCEAKATVSLARGGGALITMDGYKPRFDGEFALNPNGFSALAIKMGSTCSSPRIYGVEATAWKGQRVIDMSEPGAGHTGEFEDLMVSCDDKKRHAIILPQSEPGTVGLRRFEDIDGGGNAVLDLAGSNVTFITNCTMYGFKMNDDSRAHKIFESRFAYDHNAGEVMDIRGANLEFKGNHVFGHARLYCQNSLIDQYDAGRTIMSGSYQNTVLRFPGCPFTVDNSGAPGSNTIPRG